MRIVARRPWMPERRKGEQNAIELKIRQITKTHFDFMK
jgi:hypothetical protein